jgi:hypothetical protein
VATATRASAAGSPCGMIIASHTTEGEASMDTSTSTRPPLAACTRPSLIPTNRGTAPSPANASCMRAAEAPSTPSATRIAIRRVLIPTAPGRAKRDNAADACTSGRGARRRALGSGSGSSAIPRPSATAFASSSATRVLVVGDRHPLVRRQRAPARIDADPIERRVARVDASGRIAAADLVRRVELGERAPRHPGMGWVDGLAPDRLGTRPEFRRLCRVGTERRPRRPPFPPSSRWPRR